MGKSLGVGTHYTAEIKVCMEKVQPLNYAEEAFYNSTLALKAFSSGLEIGSCNWKINAPRRNLVYLSSSIFESAQAVDFDFHSLQGADIILFSDMASLNDCEEDFNLNGCSKSDANDIEKDLVSVNTLITGTIMTEEDEAAKFLMDNSEILEENDKLNFVTSSIVDSVREGGSVLIPIGRIGIALHLLELISDLLESLSLEVPIFMVSTTAEQTLALTNSIPEWLCRKRQQKLFCGKPSFGHVDLVKEKKLHAFPLLYSSNFLLTWREPCIVFTPHWTLRLGPAIHLLNHWHADPRCLLILEQEIDAEMALSPFKLVAIRVLQCSFLSGIRTSKISPLLRLLKPKLLLLHEDLMPLRSSLGSTGPLSFLFYSMNSTLRVPSLQDGFEGCLMPDLAAQLRPKRLPSKEMAIARFRAKLVLNKGRYFAVSPEKPRLPKLKMLLWGSVDAAALSEALKARGMDSSIAKNEATFLDVDARAFTTLLSEDAVIETSATKTVICARDAAVAKLICEAIGSICDGI